MKIYIRMLHWGVRRVDVVVAVVLVLRNEMVLELVCGANGVLPPFRLPPPPLGRVRVGPLPPFHTAARAERCEIYYT